MKVKLKVKLKGYRYRYRHVFRLNKVLFTYLPTHQSINPSINPSLSLSINPIHKSIFIYNFLLYISIIERGDLHRGKGKGRGQRIQIQTCTTWAGLTNNIYLPTHQSINHSINQPTNHPLSPSIKSIHKSNSQIQFTNQSSSTPSHYTYKSKPQRRRNPTQINK